MVCNQPSDCFQHSVPSHKVSFVNIVLRYGSDLEVSPVWKQLSKRIIKALPNSLSNADVTFRPDNRYRTITDLQGTGAAQKGRFRLQNIPVSNPPGNPKVLLLSDQAYLVSELDQRVTQVMNGGRNARAYRVQQDPNKRVADCRYLVDLVAPDNSANPLPAKAAGQDMFLFTNRALLEAHIRETMQLLQGRPAEGMHVVEHLLLRPVDDSTTVLAPVAFPGAGGEVFIPDPHSFQVSIFLPGWAPRFQDPEFRVVVERVLRRELPAHVFPYIYWVELDVNQQVPAEFTAFETAWRNWLEKQFTADRPAAQDQLVSTINQLVVAPVVTPTYRHQPFVL